jgi:hypothetical protein
MISLANQKFMYISGSGTFQSWSQSKMEEKSKHVKIVVYENEWPEVRRFARKIIQVEQKWEEKYYSATKRFGVFGEKASNKFTDLIRVSRKNVSQVVQTYPQITIGMVGLTVAIASRRYNLSYFSALRNSIFGMGGLSLLCYPKQIVPFLVDPKGQFTKYTKKE